MRTSAIGVHRSDIPRARDTVIVRWTSHSKIYLPTTHQQSARTKTMPLTVKGNGCCDLVNNLEDGFSHPPVIPEKESAPRLLLSREVVQLPTGYITEDTQHAAPEKRAADDHNDNGVAEKPESWIFWHQALDQRRHKRLA
jgi:hypothetical protein